MRYTVWALTNLKLRSVTCVFLLSALFFRGLWDFRTPLDWDEIDAAARMASPETSPLGTNEDYGNVDMINPLVNTRNHSLANLMSLGAMKIVGVSENSARLPALLFGLLLLTTLYFLYRRMMGAAIFLLLSLHLLLNESVVWYTHSMRGYVSMMASTLILFSLALASSKGLLVDKKWSYAAFIAAIVVNGFTHSFASVFGLIAVGCYGLWVYFNGRLIDLKLNTHAQKFFLAGAVASLIPLTILVIQFFYLNRIGNLRSTAEANAFVSIATTFGLVGFGWAAFMMTVVIGGIALRLIQLGEKWYADYHLLFVGASVLSIFLMLVVLKPSFFEGRFLLGFLIPLVWLLLEATPSGSAARKGYIAALLLFLVVGPVLSRAEIFHARTVQYGDYDTFVRQVRVITNSLQHPCFSFSGEADQARFSRDLYFYKKTPKRAAVCNEYFHLHFGKSWEGSLTWTPPEGVQAQDLLGDGKGRHLYRLTLPGTSVVG